MLIFLVPATTIYFGTYEFVKRKMIGLRIGIPDTIVHLAAGGKTTVHFLIFYNFLSCLHFKIIILSGSIGDIMASVVYVPSEVCPVTYSIHFHII